MSVIDSKSKVSCRAGFGAYLALSILLSIGFGYSMSSMHSQKSLVELAEQQAKERGAINRRHAAEKKYLREQLAARNATIARQSDQLATNGSKAAEGTKAAIQLIDKQTPEVKAQ